MSKADFRIHLADAYELLNEKGLGATDYIFFRIETLKNGNGMECFLV